MALTKVTGQVIKSDTNVTVGVITATKFVGPIETTGDVSAVDGTFTGSVSIAGTLTYADVTNVDSLGIVTARHGFRATAGGINVTAGISTFGGNIDANGTLDVDGDTQLDDLNVAGVSTFSALVDANNRIDVVGGANIDQINATGISTMASAEVTGNLSIADKIVHTGDTNTALRFPTADTFTVETAGAENMRAASGVVAIGTNYTSGSGSKLRVGTLFRTASGDLPDGGISIVPTTGSTVTTGEVMPMISASGSGSAPGISRAGIAAVSTNGRSAMDMVFCTRSAADGTSLDVNDDEKLRITSGGAVGINTSVPSTGQDLTFDGASNYKAGILYKQAGVNQYRFMCEGGTGHVYYDTYVDGGDHIFRTNAAAGADEKLRITEEGKVRVGSGDPAYEFELIGSGAKHILIGSTNAAGATLILDGDSNGDGSGTDYATLMHSTAGDLEINNRKNATILFKTGSSEDERLRITSDGDVWHGTQSSTARFAIVGSSAQTSATHADTNGASLILSNTDTTNNNWQGVEFSDRTDSGDFITGMLSQCTNHSQNYGDLTFWTNSAGGRTEKLRITSEGKIGIGDDDPDGNYLLIRAASTFQTTKGHIMLTGDSATNGQGPQIVFSESGSGSSYAGAYIGHVRTTSNSVGDLVFGCRASSGDANTVPTEYLRITSVGDVTLGYAGSSLYFQNGFNNSTSRIQNGGASNSSNLKFYTRSSGTEGERLRIDKDGRLIMGLATDAVGDAYYYDDIVINNMSGGSGGGGGAGIQLLSHSGSWGGLIFGDQTSSCQRGYVKYDHGSDTMWFGTADSNRGKFVSGVFQVANSDNGTNSELEVFKSVGNTSEFARLSVGYDASNCFKIWRPRNSSTITSDVNQSDAEYHLKMQGNTVLAFKAYNGQYGGIIHKTTANGVTGALVDTTGRQHSDNNNFQTSTKTNLSTGWYTIAVTGGGRATGRFGIRERQSSRHQACTFYAGHEYGASINQNCINTIFTNGRNSGNPLGALRLRTLGTYDGAALQVYIRDGTNSVQAFMLGDNFEGSGWYMRDWIADGTDPGGLSGTWANFNAVGAYSDLNELQYGGASFDGHTIPGTDNAWTFGRGSYRWQALYAVNSSIQTSDENLKQDISALTTAEMNAAKRLSGLFKTYKWKDSVAEKGSSNARIHSGIIAQQVKSAMEAESLDPAKYSFYCIDEWYEDSEGTKLPLDVPTRQGDVVEDLNAPLGGNIVVPSGFNKVTRYSVRYEELFAFIAAYNEQRFTSIESRLAALE